MLVIFRLHWILRYYNHPFHPLISRDEGVDLAASVDEHSVEHISRPLLRQHIQLQNNNSTPKQHVPKTETARGC